MTDQRLNLWLEDNYHDQLALRIRIKSTLASSISSFQKIDVYDTWAMGRVLCLGGRISLTENDEAIYSEGLTHPAMACHDQPKNILILGGGDGTVAREALKYPHVQRIDVVEIDEELTQVALEYFPQCASSLKDPKVNLIFDDAHHYLSDCENQYDVIIVDADQLHDSLSDAVQSLPFGTAVSRALNDHGILIAPLGIPGLGAASCRDNLDHLTTTFETVSTYSFSTPSTLGYEWAVAWCTNGSRRMDHIQTEPEPAQVDFWSPAIHNGLFDLPGHIRRTLGL